MTHRTFLLIVLMTGLAVAPSTAAYAQEAEDVAPVPLSAADRDAVLDWFESLDYPVLDGGRLVWVTTWGQRGLGFLVEQSADGAAEDGGEKTGRRLFYGLDLGELDLDQPWMDRAGIEIEPATDLPGALDEWVRGLPPETGEWNPSETINRLSPRGRLVVVAAVYRKHAMDKRAARALADAATRTGFLDRRGHDPKSAWLERVAQDFELIERRRAWRGGGTLAARRERLLDYARRFPETSHTGRAEYHARVLLRMVAEESSAPTADEVAELERTAPVDEVVDALVFRMRYAAGGPSAMGGHGSLKYSNDGDHPPVVERLRALGDRALPRLVVHSTDETLSRSTSEGRVGMTPGVVTVGEWCTALVAEISGERLFGGSHVRAWWAAKHAEREPAGLIRNVLDWEATKNDAALLAARTLLERYPQHAFHAIDAAAHIRGGAWQSLEDRLPWIELLASVAAQGGMTRRRVVSRLTSDASFGRLTHRAGAILALAPLDLRAALRAARVIWREMPDESHVSGRWNGNLSALVRSESIGAQKVIAFLVAEGQLDLIADRVARQRRYVRLWTASAVGEGVDLEVQRELPARLLVRLLGDREVVPGPWDLSGVQVTDPRVCDAAAAALATRDAERFAFDAAAEIDVRDAAIARIVETLGRE